MWYRFLKTNDTISKENNISAGFFFKYGANLGCFNIIGTFSSLFFLMTFPQKQHELTNCFFIIIILALLHFTDGKKTLLNQSFFPMNTTPESSRSVSENLSDGGVIMYHWEKKAIQGQILIQAGLCKYTELQPVKMRPFQCTFHS